MRVTWATRSVKMFVTSADAGSWRQMQAREAYARLCAFMQTHDVHFHGAGEAGLPRITQCWSVAHTDPAKMRANRETISGVAAILREYPGLTILVHGETGAASAAPRVLADHFGRHHVHDVESLMDELARHRAQACKDALVAAGVPDGQLTIRYTGRGGASKVDFVPEGMGGAGSGGDSKAAEAEMAKMASELAPLPTGIPYELRLTKGGSVLMAGVTTATGATEVRCEIPHNERLIVGQTYIFETFHGPGTDPNACEFTIALFRPAMTAVQTAGVSEFRTVANSLCSKSDDHDNTCTL